MIKAITPEHEGGAVSILSQGRFEFYEVTRCGITFDKGTTRDEWLSAVQKISGIWEGAAMTKERALMLLADALNYGENEYGEEFAQAISGMKDALGLSPSRISNACWVYKAVPVSRRRETLTFGHYEVIAALKPDEQEEFVRQADSEQMTVKALKDVVRTRHPLPAKKTKPRAIVSIETGNPAAVTDALQILGNLLADPKTEILPDWQEHMAAIYRRYRKEFMGNGHRRD